MKKILLGVFFSICLLFAKVDINHANEFELTKLNGIGKVKAQRIVEYIKQNGCFEKMEDIVFVKGIGEKTLLKNKDIIEILPCKEKSK